MSALTLLADLDASQLNGGSNGGWGRPRQPKTGYRSTSIKSAKTFSAQGNVSNNLALGLGIGGLGFANATSEQENVAFIGTVAAWAPVHQHRPTSLFLNMTSITHLDDLNCQALTGGSGKLLTYKPMVCRPKCGPYHMSTKHVSMASTYSAQGNYASNTALGLGHLAGFANAESFQSNVANIITMAGWAAMEMITDTQAESLRGGRLFSITVAPTIVVSNAISTALQGNVGNAFALSGFGPANAAVGQLNGLLSFTASAA